MFEHFFRNTFRIFSRNGIYTLINLFGLSIGLTAVILILMYVAHELSYERFHKNGRNTYLVNMVYHTQNYTDDGFTIPAAIGPSLHEAFPEVLSFNRFRNPSGAYFAYEDRIYQFENVSWTDSSFFSDFSFRLIRGNPATVLASPYSLVLTEKSAGIIFGDEDPIGKVVRLNNAEQYVVTGIAENPPTNTSFRFDALLSFVTLYEDKSLFMGWDGGNQYFNFITVAPDINWQMFREKLQPFLYEKINRRYEQAGVRVELDFEPIRSYHFRFGRLESGIQISVAIYIFSIIALLVLLIACFNFTNLSTARAMTRAKETGIRKVVGATRQQLIHQFLAEAVFMSLIAFGFSLIIIELVHPWYNAIIGIELSFYQSPFRFFLPSLFLIVFLTGILAGAYPAFFLSSFQPVKVLKGSVVSGRNKARFSRFLVVLQFVISVALINVTFLIYSQLSYVRRFDPGMNTHDILCIHLPSRQAQDGCEVLQNEIRNLAGVLSCGAASEIPGAGVTSNGYRPEGYEEVLMIHVIDIDDAFLETFGLELVEGRNFVQGSVADRKSYLVNETFVKQFEYSEPIGVKVQRDGNRPIIGVVKDFHFSSLHEPIKPLILTNEPWQGFSYLLIRFNPANRDQIQQQTEDLWKAIMPGEPFISRFMDEYLEGSYAAERRFGGLFTWFSVFAILLATLGLFGLSSYSVQQRKKEIGLKKLLGASNGNILAMLTVSFVLMVLLANILALFPALYLTKLFLDYYSYAVHPGPTMFILTGLGSLLFAWLTVAWQSFRVVRTKPAEVLKYE